MAGLDKAIARFSWERVQSTNGAAIEEDVREARAALGAASKIAFPN